MNFFKINIMKMLDEFKMHDLKVMNDAEVKSVRGGDKATVEMIAAIWDATPDGGFSTWENKGDCCTGYIFTPGEGLSRETLCRF